MNNTFNIEDHFKTISTNREIKIEDILKELESISNEDELVILLDKNYNTLIDKNNIIEIIDYIKNNFLDNNDLFLLSNHHDNIEKIKVIDSNFNLNFYETASPIGFNCGVTTVSKWKEIFSKIEKTIYLKDIFSPRIKAISSYPRIFYPKLENKIRDISAYNQWRPVEKFGRKIPNTHKYSFWWFILTCIISLIVVLYLLKKIPKDRFYKINKDNKVVVI